MGECVDVVCLELSIAQRLEQGEINEEGEERKARKRKGGGGGGLACSPHLGIVAIETNMRASLQSSALPHSLPFPNTG